MRDAFASFCSALFNQELREVAVTELREAGILVGSAPVPDSMEEHVSLVERLPPHALLRLIYRYQFLNPLNTYEAVRSYVDNAPRKTQFIDEFVQNAEDAGSRLCRFDFYDDHIVVANDGRAFSHANLYSLCSFRESDKANLDRNRQIGKFGVGFKSVFRICRKPLIVTWKAEWPEPVAFYFFPPRLCDEAYHRKLEKVATFACPPQVPERNWGGLHKDIGYLFPVPMALGGDAEAAYDNMRRDCGEGSLFVLPLEPDLLRPGDYDRTVSGVRPESFTFLNMELLEVHDHRSGGGHAHKFSKSTLEDRTSGGIDLLQVHELETRRDERRSYQVVRGVYDDVPVPVERLQRLDQLARESLPSRVRITFVVQLEEGKGIGEPELDPRRRKGQLFTGLRVSAEGTGFNFHIDAPFNLTADRDNILDDGFNQWLIDQVAEAAEKFLREVRDMPRFREQLYRLVPSPDDFTGAGAAASTRLNPLFKPIHNRLLTTALDCGVLPALDGGQPLRAFEAVALLSGNARPDVSTALQELFGSQSADFFRGIEPQLRGETIRFCRVPKDEDRILEILVRTWNVPEFRCSWVEAFLGNPDQVRRATERDRKWYRHFLVYAAFGVAPAVWTKPRELKWVPAVNDADSPIAPRDAWMVPDACREELEIIAAAFRAGAQGDGAAVRSFVDPEFAEALLVAREATDNEEKEWVRTQAIKRLETISPQRLTWSKLLDELSAKIEPNGPTPEPILVVFALAHEKSLIDARLTRQLAGLFCVPTKELGGPETAPTTPCLVRDLWLTRSREVSGLPDQVEPLLPRLADGLSPRILALVDHLAPSLPSPTLLKRTLQRLPNPSKKTAAWVFRVWQAWQQRISTRAEDAPHRTDVPEAIGVLRLPGKETNEWHVLSDYFANGFGERSHPLQPNLTTLFGPREPDLREYAPAFTRHNFETLLRACKETERQSEYLPGAEDVETAIERLSRSPAEQKPDLTADLCSYLVDVLEAVRGRSGSHECERIKQILRSRAWLTVFGRESLALPEDVVRVDDDQLADVLQCCVPILAWPSESVRRERFKKALDRLVADRAINFLAPKALKEDAQQCVVRRLCELAGQITPDNSKEAHLAWRRLVRTIGALLEHRWLPASSLEFLREHVELTHFTKQEAPHSRSAWVICETNGQREQFSKTFPRGVIVVSESKRLVRSGLAGLTRGFLAAQAAGAVTAHPLDDAGFAGNYLRALGELLCCHVAAADRQQSVLRPQEQQNVLQAYRALLRTSRANSLFQPGDHVIFTHSSTLQASMAPVFAGRDPRVRSVLAEKAPHQLLANSVLTEFSADDQVRLLDILGVKADDQIPEAERVAEDRTPHVIHGPYTVRPDDRPFLCRALRQLCADDLVPGLPDHRLADSRIERVEKIEQRLTFLPTGHGIVKTLDHWFDLQPVPVVYLTEDGIAELELVLEAYRDAEAARWREAERSAFAEREAVFHKDLESAKNQIVRWARDQQEDVLGYYRQTSADTRFREEDNRARAHDKTVSERWEVFVGEPERIELLIKKHTVDVGYGVETIVREMLQNADDAYHRVSDLGPWVEFSCDGSSLTVRHAGRRFNAPLAADESGNTPNDVLRICSSGGSEKSERHQIGRYGLGFKSVFAVTSEPVVLSHPYYFRIRHVLVPEWEDPGQHISDHAEWRKWVTSPTEETRFILDSSQSAPVQQQRMCGLHQRLATGQELHGTDLLFLRHVRRATARAGGQARTVSRDPDVTASPSEIPFPRQVTGTLVSSEIRRVSSSAAADQRNVLTFLAFTAQCSAPVPTGTAVRIQELEYAVAFLWNESANCFAKFPDEVSRVIYLFLPTKEKTGFPFLVHGQFLTNLGRTDIDGGPECNRTLAVATARLVEETIRSAFDLWQDDPVRLRSIYYVIPLPRESFWGSDWLDPIRAVFGTMLQNDEPVVLTASDALAKPSECRLASEFVHRFCDELRRKLGSNLSLPSLVHREIETLIESCQRSRGYVKRLRIPELAQLLFPTGLSRPEVIRRATAVFRFLLQHENAADLALETEQDALLKRLSEVPCFPDSTGGVDRPVDLPWPHAGSPSETRSADIDAVAGDDIPLREWLRRKLIWQPPRTTPTPPEPDSEYAFEVLVTTEQREQLWAHNLRRIVDWWANLGDAERQTIEDRYSLTGDDCYPILGLRDVPRNERRDEIQCALREETPGHPQAWFRVLCLANISQSGRRFSEGMAFLRQFDKEFDGFERIWQFAGHSDGRDVVDHIIRDVLNAAARDRLSPDRTFYWRHLYDFVKIRQLLTERQFIEGFWEVAERHPTELPRYLHQGVIPGDRLPHRGLGESLSSQAFFVCREAFRLGLVTDPHARACCYYPNRHLRRLFGHVFGPPYPDWADFQDHERLSHCLHRDVTRFTDSNDFADAFDIPLMHLAMESLSPLSGLAMRDDPTSVQEVLSES